MKVLLVVLIVIVVVLLYAATRPDAFRLQRSLLINAAPDKIFAALNDFQCWAAWSPWEKLDPAMQRSYSGAASGNGAIYAWQGNRKVGAGRMQILDSTPNAALKIKLDFLKPMEAHNTCEFTLLPQGNQTLVTWAMYGPSNYASKLMTTFISMDKMVGGDFERGLANLQALAEKS